MENTVEEPLASYNQPLTFEKVWQMFQETDKKFQETDRLFKETDKKLNKLEKELTSKWGKLMESLVEGDLIKLLRKRKIVVHHTSKNAKGNYRGENYEYDIIAVNEELVVIVEVKTTLRTEDVELFHRKLWKAKTYMSEYKNKIIYGAMAYLSVEGEAHRMAENQGFLVIRATGSSSSIINAPDFIPKMF